jgi:flagellar biosynthesis protein FliQ
LIAPLIKRFHTKNVLACAILVFGLCTAILLILDGATGGTIRPWDWSKTHKKGDFSYYGDYNTDAIIPIYCVAGIAYGMVELIRRVVPKDIVGGNVQKLRRLDSLVHIFYEVSGTAGAFCTALVLIPSLGNNYSFVITPILFTVASTVWYFIIDPSKINPDSSQENPEDAFAGATKVSYIKSVLGGFWLFFDSVWTGGKLIFGNRKFIWLIPGYSLALYGHRYLENGIAPAVAKRYLGTSAWSQIMVGGSNFGELLGALFVFLFTQVVKTPIPWLRLDSLMLLIVWYIPYWNPPRGRVKDAWMVAATFIPVSFGWAAGDVSLAAYIQASLSRVETNKKVSPLGTVMAFLYSTYIVIYAIAGPLLGRYLDRVFAQTGSIHSALVNVGGVQFTIIFAIIMAATFVPDGALSFNPKMLNNEDLESELEENMGVDEFDGAVQKEKVGLDGRTDSV